MKWVAGLGHTEDIAVFAAAAMRKAKDVAEDVEQQDLVLKLREKTMNFGEDRTWGLTDSLLTANSSKEGPAEAANPKFGPQLGLGSAFAVSKFTAAARKSIKPGSEETTLKTPLGPASHRYQLNSDRMGGGKAV